MIDSNCKLTVGPILLGIGKAHSHDSMMQNGTGEPGIFCDIIT